MQHPLSAGGHGMPTAQTPAASWVTGHRTTGPTSNSRRRTSCGPSGSSPSTLAAPSVSPTPPQPRCSTPPQHPARMGTAPSLSLEVAAKGQQRRVFAEPSNVSFARDWLSLFFSTTAASWLTRMMAHVLNSTAKCKAWSRDITEPHV